MARAASTGLVVVLLATAFLVLVPSIASAQGLSFATTADFDSGTKSGGGDGNYLVETSTDNPGIGPDRLELGSLKGDGFTVPDSDADTYKWDIPSSTCVVRLPTTIVRNVSDGVLHLGSNKTAQTTYVGVVQSVGVTGDVDVRLAVHRVHTDPGSRFVLQLVNEHRCYVESTPKTADGVQFVWDEGGSATDGVYGLQVVRVTNGTETLLLSRAATLDPVYMRITRSGDTWGFYYSADGASWTLEYRLVHAVAGPLYAALMEKDNKGGVTTRFDIGGFRYALGNLTAGGYRTTGAWTSPAFAIPAGEVLDHVALSGTFDATYALDRVEILRGGSVLETFEDDNSPVVYPAAPIGGTDLAVRLTLKGDGLGTPALTHVELAFRSSFPVTGESVALGTSTGILNETRSDDLVDAKTEGLGPVASTTLPEGQAVVTGLQVSGTAPPSPSDTDVFDGTSVQYGEANVATSSATTPDTQNLSEGSAGGPFPGCAASADGNACSLTEAGTTTETSFFPATQSVGVGSQVAGTFPNDVEASDDTYLQYDEGPSGSLTTDYVPSSQTVLLGSEGIGSTYKQGDFARKTDGPGIQPVTGVGFQGRALILWWTRQAAYGDTAPNIAGIGLIASPTQQYAMGWADDNNVVPSNSGRRSGAMAVILLLSGTPTVDGEASFLGFTADGFDLDWTTNPNPAQPTILHYIVLGSVVTNAYVGQFVGPAAGVTGLRSYAGVGFRGDAAFFLGGLQKSLGSSAQGAMGFGMATGPTSRGSVAIAIPDATTTANNRVMDDNRRCLIEYNPALSTPATDQLMDFASFDADGFTLNHVQTVTGNVLFWALVIKGGSYQANYFTRQASLGDQAVTGVGFRPNGVLIFGGASYLSFGASDTGAEVSMGAGSSTKAGVAQAVTWSGSNDARSPAQAHVSTMNNQVVRDLSLSSQSAQNIASFKSSDANGFTVTWTAIQSSSGQKWFYFAFGGQATGNPYPGCIQSADGALCSYSESLQSATNDYRVAVRYAWSGVPTSGDAWRLIAQGREGGTNPESIQVGVYGSNGADTTNASCALVSTTNTLYDCGLLNSDQLNLGSPAVLFYDTVRSPDPDPSSFDLDTVYIQRTATTYALTVDYAWSGVPLGGASYELRLEGHVSDGVVQIQVLTPPEAWTTRLALASATDTTLVYTLTAGEFNSGSPTIRLQDSDPADLAASSLWLDRVRIVRLDTTYRLSAQYEWTGTVTVTDSDALEMNASVLGDAERVLVEIFDWQNGTWRPGFTIAGAAPATYSTPLATACTADPGDCEISSAPAGSVRIRVTDLDPADTTQTTLAVDRAVVRGETVGYALDVRYNWTLGGRSGEDTLWVGGNRSDEDVLVQVYDWIGAAWTTAFLVNSTVDGLASHVLASSEVSSALRVVVRFVGAQDLVDAVPSGFWLDYASITSREYGLNLTSSVTGIGGPGPFTLSFEGRLAADGENFNVYVYDWTAGGWTVWLVSALATTDRVFQRSLLPSEVSGGEVRVLLEDSGAAFDSVPSTVYVDLIAVG